MNKLYKWIYKINFWQKGISAKDLTNELFRDSCSVDGINEIQKNKLRNFLKYCNKESPFYTERFKEYGVDATAENIFDEIKKMPPLTKDEITDNIDKIIPSRFKDKDGLIKKATGGSTGTPLVLWGDKEDYRQNGMVIARQRNWIGWNGGMRSLTLFGGFRDVPSHARAILKEIVLNERFINIMDRNNADYNTLTNEIISFQPQAIIGYFSLLQEVGKALKQRSIKIDSLKLIIAAAEPLNEDARQDVEKAFGVPVYFQYGNRELGTFAQECKEQKGYHYAQDHYYCEVLDDDDNDADYGKLTITYFDNRVTPLIRYQIGDGASLDAEPCKCGLPYHRLGVIDGRLTSMILLPSGQKITSNIFPHIFKDYSWVGEFQIEQTTQEKLIIRVRKKKEKFTDSSFKEINEKIEDLLGKDMTLEWKYDAPFLPVPTGKHIYFIDSMDK